MACSALARAEGVGLLVEAEIGLAAAFVRPVASETAIGKQRANVPIILQRGRRRGDDEARQKKPKPHRNPPR